MPAKAPWIIDISGDDTPLGVTPLEFTDLPGGHRVLVQCDQTITVKFWNGTDFQATGETIAAPGGQLYLMNRKAQISAAGNTMLRMRHIKEKH